VLVATYTGWALTLRGVGQRRLSSFVGGSTDRGQAVSPRQTTDMLVRYDYLPRWTPSPTSSYRKTCSWSITGPERLIVPAATKDSRKDVALLMQTIMLKPSPDGFDHCSGERLSGLGLILGLILEPK
jgi:hypothetical protein